MSLTPDEERAAWEIVGGQACPDCGSTEIAVEDDGERGAYAYCQCCGALLWPGGLLDQK